MMNEENKTCGCGGMCGGRCGGGMEGGMGMWMHMPKEVKVAKLEKKEAMLKAELDFVGKMLDMVKKMPEEKK
jgi:hypothetical protein